jgi:hypothetical protein
MSNKGGGMKQEFIRPSAKKRKAWRWLQANTFIYLYRKHQPSIHEPHLNIPVLIKCILQSISCLGLLGLRRYARSCLGFRGQQPVWACLEERCLAYFPLELRTWGYNENQFF